MTVADQRYKSRTGQRWTTAILIGLLWLAAFGYSTAKPGFTPVDASPVTLAASALPTSQAAGEAGDPNQSPVTPASALRPFLDIVPGQDGTELFISAGGVSELGGMVFANLGVGPGHQKGSYTMPYSDTQQAHVVTVAGFTPRLNDYGSISITTTLGLDTGEVEFNRAYLPASTSQTIYSMDGNLQLTLVTTDTVTYDTYAVIVPSYAPPGPPPLGHRLVGSAYSVRAASALVETDRPMNLRLSYSEAALGGADPHTLAIFAWDAYYKRWDDLGGRLFYDRRYLSVSTSRFTTYALMATSTWRDEFDDFNGLNFPDEVSNVTLGGTLEDRALVLVSTATSGSAVSKPIAPVTDFVHWDSLTFARTVDPPTTTLTVDVLACDGSVVLADVTSGVDLSELEASQYPCLKLRANLSSAVAGTTPALYRWQLIWQVKQYKVYLPIVGHEKGSY